MHEFVLLFMGVQVSLEIRGLGARVTGVVSSFRQCKYCVTWSSVRAVHILNGLAISETIYLLFIF